MLLLLLLFWYDEMVLIMCTVVAAAATTATSCFVFQVAGWVLLPVLAHDDKGFLRCAPLLSWIANQTIKRLLL